MMLIKLTDTATIGHSNVRHRRDQCNCKLSTPYNCTAVPALVESCNTSDSNRDYQSYKLIFPLEISVGHLSTSTQQLLLPLTLICTNHHQQITASLVTQKEKLSGVFISDFEKSAFLRHPSVHVINPILSSLAAA